MRTKQSGVSNSYQAAAMEQMAAKQFRRAIESGSLTRNEVNAYMNRLMRSFDYGPRDAKRIGKAITEKLMALNSVNLPHSRGPACVVKVQPPKPKLSPALKAASDKAFFESREWRELRYATLKRYGFRCMACKRSNLELRVDHIKPRSRYPSLALDPTNLQVLCKDCNLGKGAWDESDLRPKN